MLIAIAKIIAMTDSTIFSPMNCTTSCFLFPPSTFLIPISLRRLLEVANEVLVKLKQAINNIKAAIIMGTITAGFGGGWLNHCALSPSAMSP